MTAFDYFVWVAVVSWSVYWVWKGRVRDRLSGRSRVPRSEVLLCLDCSHPDHYGYDGRPCAADMPRPVKWATRQVRPVDVSSFPDSPVIGTITTPDGPVALLQVPVEWEASACPCVSGVGQTRIGVDDPPIRPYSGMP